MGEGFCKSFLKSFTVKFKFRKINVDIIEVFESTVGVTKRYDCFKFFRDAGVDSIGIN